MKVKIAIAAVIVIALVALIVVDQTSAPENQNATKKENNEEKGSLFTHTRKGENPARTNRTTEMIFRNPNGNRTPSETTDTRSHTPETIAPGEKDSIKGENSPGTAKEETRIKAVDIVGMEFEEYKIRPGDTLSSISARKYGDQNLWKVIANANPGIRASALRVGKKIKIPSRPITTSDDKIIETISGRRTYTVQPGDTLSGISKKIFKTTKHADRIYKENRALMETPHQLRVGTKLILPDIQERISTPPPDTLVEENAELLGKMIHRVKTNDSLWKIAEKYREGKNILHVIENIVTANPKKLFNDNTPLKVGWKLVIPY